MSSFTIAAAINSMCLIAIFGMNYRNQEREIERLKAALTQQMGETNNKLSLAGSPVFDGHQVFFQHKQRNDDKWQMAYGGIVEGENMMWRVVTYKKGVELAKPGAKECKQTMK
jgi:hypothetical protein